MAGRTIDALLGFEADTGHSRVELRPAIPRTAEASETICATLPFVNGKTASEWQWRSRPLMIGMLVTLSAFFFAATLYQLYDLNRRIDQSPQLDARALLAPAECRESPTSASCVELKRLNIGALLEANVVARRYHQASVLLMASIWSRYLGFVTGMILALVGAAFILGQLRDEGTHLEGEAGTAKLKLLSASPGLVLAVLGVVLMTIAMTTLHQLNTIDVPQYVSAPSGRPSLADPDARTGSSPMPTTPPAR